MLLKTIGQMISTKTKAKITKSFKLNIQKGTKKEAEGLRYENKSIYDLVNLIKSHKVEYLNGDRQPPEDLNDSLEEFHKNSIEERRKFLATLV